MIKSFSYIQFKSLQKLVQTKKAKGLTVGVALPVLNEERTIAKTIEMVRSCRDLIDDLIVVDSGSTDKSAKISKRLGVSVITDSRAAQDLGVNLVRGKGFNLWTSVHYLKTDIIVWLDTDIKNINRGFILGIAGPLIENDDIKFVKGYYRRPKGDARVTEILVRPFTSIVFPELNEFIQPLSGEYGGRREFLRSLTFYSGYGVEIATLLQSRLTLRDFELAQSFLGRRYHELQTVSSLGRMGVGILHTLFDLARRYRRLNFKDRAIFDSLHQFVLKDGEEFVPKEFTIRDQPLQPMEKIDQ